MTLKKMKVKGRQSIYQAAITQEHAGITEFQTETYGEKCHSIDEAPTNKNQQ
jgi:hypothetical protein